jgi:hypothetical protein
MQWMSIITLALLTRSTHAQAMLRFACSQLVVERLDPVGTPGELPSPHLYQVVGGNSFNATMDLANHDPAVGQDLRR